MEALKVIKKAELVLEFSDENGNENKIRLGESALYVSINSILAQTSRYKNSLELRYDRINKIEIDENFGDSSRLDIYFDESKFSVVAGKEYTDYMYAIKHLLMPIISDKKN